MTDTRIAKRAPLTKAIPAGSVGPRTAETLFERIEARHVRDVIRAAHGLINMEPGGDNQGLTNEEAVSAMLIEIKHAEDERRAARKAVALLQSMHLI